MLKNIWKDPVVSGLIVAAISTTTVVAYFTRFFGWVWGILCFVGKWLGESSQFPNWAIVLLIFALIPTLLIVVALYLDARHSNSDPTPFDYKEDRFFNMKWRWNYAGNKMVGMNCYCPYCDYQIFPTESDDYGGGFIRKCKFFCESCNSSLYSAEGYALDVKQKAELHAQRKIRTGEWKSTLQQCT